MSRDTTKSRLVTDRCAYGYSSGFGYRVNKSENVTETIS